ncbi:MAG: hypothetical protein WCG27_01490 [Pseudomonadota bacterium]
MKVLLISALFSLFLSVSSWGQTDPKTPKQLGENQKEKSEERCLSSDERKEILKEIDDIVVMLAKYAKLTNFKGSSGHKFTISVDKLDHLTKFVQNEMPMHGEPWINEDSPALKTLVDEIRKWDGDFAKFGPSEVRKSSEALNQKLEQIKSHYGSIGNFAPGLHLQKIIFSYAQYQNFYIPKSVYIMLDKKDRELARYEISCPNDLPANYQAINQKTNPPSTSTSLRKNGSDLQKPTKQGNLQVIPGETVVEKKEENKKD